MSFVFGYIPFDNRAVPGLRPGQRAASIPVVPEPVISEDGGAVTLPGGTVFQSDTLTFDYLGPNAQGNQVVQVEVIPGPAPNALPAAGGVLLETTVLTQADSTRLTANGLPFIPMPILDYDEMITSYLRGFELLTLPDNSQALGVLTSGVYCIDFRALIGAVEYPTNAYYTIALVIYLTRDGVRQAVGYDLTVTPYNVELSNETKLELQAGDILSFGFEFSENIISAPLLGVNLVSPGGGELPPIQVPTTVINVGLASADQLVDDE